MQIDNCKVIQTLEVALL